MKLREQPESGAGESSHSTREDAASGVALEYCPNCSAKLVGQSCKLQCPRCGYFLSCSDYY
jgi:exosome complex RNA-binding protein Csl4